MAVTVNGEEITGAEIEQEVERLRPHYEQYVKAHGAEGGEEQLQDWARENVVERTLLRQEAGNLDIEIPPEEIDAAYERIEAQQGAGADKAALHGEIRLHMKMDRLVNQTIADVGEPTEEELQAYYQQHSEEFRTPEQIHAAHVVKHIDAHTDRKAALAVMQEVKAKLDAGEPFEEVANGMSDCAGNGGDLGYFGREQMVQEFEDVVFAMEPGQVSGVFMTAFGYHIAKLLDRKAGEPVPFEKVKDDITKELLEQRRNKAMETYVDGLKEKATIEDVSG